MQVRGMGCPSGCVQWCSECEPTCSGSSFSSVRRQRKRQISTPYAPTTDGLRAPETADKQVQNYSAACWYQMAVEAEFTLNIEHLSPSSLSGKSTLSCTNKANTSPSTSQIATAPLWFPLWLAKWPECTITAYYSEKERAACSSFQIHAVKNQTRQHFTWWSWELRGCRETHIVAASWCNKDTGRWVCDCCW